MMWICWSLGVLRSIKRKKAAQSWLVWRGRHWLMTLPGKRI